MLKLSTSDLQEACTCGVAFPKRLHVTLALVGGDPGDDESLSSEQLAAFAREAMFLVTCRGCGKTYPAPVHKVTVR